MNYDFIIKTNLSDEIRVFQEFLTIPILSIRE